jgi:hypothetical protein
MKICTAKLVSESAYSQSAPVQTPRKDKELPKDYEERVWRDRLHATEDGTVFIPPMSFKNAISEAAKYLSISIPGKGKEKYTKNFEAGVMVPEAVMLGFKKEDVPGEWLFVPSDGRRGGGKRVWKCFPVIKSWTATVSFYVLDDTITPDVFEYVLSQAGRFIGVGRFRPRNNGYYGRWNVASTKWSEAA